MPESSQPTTSASPSTELTGGAGYTYEDTVVGYYLATLLRVEAGAGIGGTVTRVAVQQRPANQPLDDVVIDTSDAAGERRLSLQIKRGLTLSAAASNVEFRQIIADSRATRANAAFRVDRDAYGFVAQSVAVGPLRDFRRILELARASTNAHEFAARFEGSGATSNDQRALRQDLRPLVADTDAAEWDFYRHFVAPDLSGLEPDGALIAVLGSNLDNTLAAGKMASGASLFSTLCRMARIGAGGGKIWTRPALLHDLAPDFRLRGVPAFADDLETVGRLTTTALAEIVDQVGTHHVDRSATVDRALALLDGHRLVNITGLPGCGKSAVLRNAVERLAQEGNVLLLKSDLLVGTDWQGFAVAKGLIHRDPLELLAEIGAAGNSILCIDGIDRIPPPQRAIVKDLMRAIVEQPGLERWRVLVTSRNQGMEPFRVWVPPALYSAGGIGELSVDAFDDAEAEQLAQQAPALMPLLFGSEAVRSIARRPFFAAVLAGRGGDGTDPANAQSETDLITYWWNGGGYNARGEALVMRQRALIDLARVGARSLGKSVRAMSLTPETAVRAAELIDDGIIRSPDENATFSFAHDIFFEWAYFRLLVGLGSEWTGALVEAGQPPLLGRVVGLLAQRAIATGQPWNDGLTELAAAGLRPQWQRVWTTGPVASPQFATSATRFTQAMEDNDWARLRHFLVWFQAEQTIPNPLVLANTQLPLDGAARVRMADLAGWPGDLPTWARVIFWLTTLIERVPVRLLPLILELFKVWQNQLSSAPNPVSAAIVTICSRWLEEIDTLSYPDEFSYDRGRWDALRGDGLKTFEESLRHTILLAMRSYPAPGEAFVDRAIANERLRQDAYATITTFAPTIAGIIPHKLADLARVELLEPLPKDEIAEEKERVDRRLERLRTMRAKPEAERTEQERRALSHVSLSDFSSQRDWDLRDLAVDQHHRAYFPPSPLHEPFASLFKTNPDVALALVRDLGNHATAAWLQVHELNPRRYGAPIPLDLEFPWGRQRFWGDWDSYNWLSGYLAPQPLACALMALAYWAHTERDRGVPVDDLIRKVVEGHQSWTVLQLAGALALEAEHASATVMPIATAQRLWKMDIARAAQEPMRGFDPLGLTALNRLSGPKEAAMNYLKSRPSRLQEIRRLSAFFALSSDKGIKAAFRERLALFPTELPFDYEEEKTDSALAAHLLEQAQQWAGLGEAANYRVAPMDDGQHLMIGYESPIPLSPDTQRRAEDAVVALNEYGVAGWASQSLRARAPDPSGRLADNLAFVRERDTATLFDHLTPSGGGMAQSAVSGIAAYLLLVGPASDDERAWAADVMRRVEAMYEERDPYGGNIPWHPAFHLIAVLASGLRRPQDAADAARRLFGLCLHPNRQVAPTALAALLNAPDAALAWNATVLASDLWRYRQPIIRRGGERDDTAQRAAETDAVARAVARLADGTMTAPDALPDPGLARRRQRSILDADEGEEEPVVLFDVNSAEELMRSLPVELFCQSDTYRAPFLAFVGQLVGWTAARFERDEDDPAPVRRRRRREHVDLNLWPGRLGELLSRVAPYADIETMRTQFLGPLLEPGDENGLDVTSNFLESLVCRHVLDSPSFTPQVIALMLLCMDQVLADPQFRRGSHRAGEIHGFDLPRMIKSLLLVPLDEPAVGAARFANGDWTDLPAVLPLINRLVGEIGWAPYIMDTFLGMAERAGLAYPIDDFVALATRVLTELGDNADGWIGTMIPTRIAGVVQVLADGNYPLGATRATALLHLLDMLIDLGDRRAAALEESETFRATQTR